MFLLTPEDIEITSVQHPKRDKKVPILSYEDKTFRLLSVFGANQHAEAHTAWKDLTKNEGKLCVLLEEPARYSIWRQVRIDIDLLHPVVPEAYAKAVIVMIQALYSDVDALLGGNQAKSFGAALEKNVAKPVATAGGFGNILRLNPITEIPPKWDESDLNALLIELHRLGTRSFGRSQFTARTLAALDDLAPDDKSVFTHWLSLSLLSNLWLSRP